MDEHVIKQKIQQAYFEPRAPVALIDQVILRAQAVTMGINAQKQLESASGENLGMLASRALIGQLAAVSELPRGTQPEQLARQLEQEPAFTAALYGGNVARRLASGELMQQVVGGQSAAEPISPQIEVPQKEGPGMG